MKLDVKQVTHIFYNKKSFTLEKLNEIMDETLGIKNFTEGKTRLTKDQMEMVIGLLDVLVHTEVKEENGASKSEEHKTDSGSSQVREADGYEDNRLQGEGTRPEVDSGLDGLRSVQEVRSSPDVSDIPTDGGADSERGLYDN